jgi:hypothetical protein
MTFICFSISVITGVLATLNPAIAVMCAIMLLTYVAAVSITLLKVTY